MIYAGRKITLANRITPDVTSSRSGPSRKGDPATMNTLAKLFDVIRAANLLRTIPVVYPAYIALRIKKALQAGIDPEGIIDSESLGEIETVGDCKYRISVGDDSGNRYFVTVEVAP
jgi:hypothetical protein